MAFNVELISKELIKPSSPTPHHLRAYTFSFLDQIAPAMYTNIIFFYNVSGFVNHSERSLWLKKTLAETLTYFYPLAGRAKEDFSVDCNDEGAEFFQARVPCKLSEVIENPADSKMVNMLLPYFVHCEMQKEVLLAAQYNIFDCGGSAIGLCISHKLADGESVTMFANAWAAVSRGANEVISSNLNGSVHFAPTDTSRYDTAGGIMEKKILTKRFIFDKSSIDLLKEIASSGAVKQPTRFEAVSAFMWKRIMAISQRKRFAGIIAVNLRQRTAALPISNTFGNLVQYAIAPFSKADHDDNLDLAALVGLIRHTLQGIDQEKVENLQDGGWYLDELEKLSKNCCSGEVEVVNFTSFCRFPMYEVDFGWGRPTWANIPVSPYKNLVTLSSTKSGDGIEAWVSLLEDDMPVFERDQELLSFLSSCK